MIDLLSIIRERQSTRGAVQRERSINFDLTEEQKEIQKAVDAFAKGEIDKEAILEPERNHQFPLAYLKKASQLGFIGIHHLETYGEQGYGILENALI